MNVITTLAAEEALNPLWAPGWVFGVVPLTIFFVLGFVVYTYRDVANRHSNKSDQGHGGHH
jgi:intracellular septation protein A